MKRKDEIIKKKDEIVYETGRLEPLTQEELIEKRIASLEWRFDSLMSKIWARDSEFALYSLRKIPKLEKRINNAAQAISKSKNEFRLIRDAVFNIKESTKKKKSGAKTRTKRTKSDLYRPAAGETDGGLSGSDT